MLTWSKVSAKLSFWAPLFWCQVIDNCLLREFIFALFLVWLTKLDKVTFVLDTFFGTKLVALIKEKVQAFYSLHFKNKFAYIYWTHSLNSSSEILIPHTSEVPENEKFFLMQIMVAGCFKELNFQISKPEKNQLLRWKNMQCDWLRKLVLTVLIFQDEL